MELSEEELHDEEHTDEQSGGSDSEEEEALEDPQGAVAAEQNVLADQVLAVDVQVD